MILTTVAGAMPPGSPARLFSFFSPFLSIASLRRHGRPPASQISIARTIRRRFFISDMPGTSGSRSVAEPRNSSIPNSVQLLPKPAHLRPAPPATRESAPLSDNRYRPRPAPVSPGNRCPAIDRPRHRPEFAAFISWLTRHGADRRCGLSAQLSESGVPLSHRPS